MKYKGRIWTLFILIFIELAFFTYFYNKYGYIDNFQIFMLPLLFFIAWLLGRVFDKYQFMLEESNKSNENLQKIFEIAPIGIIVHKDSNFVYVNSGTLKMLSLDNPEELIGKSIFDVIHPNFHKTVYSNFINIEENYKNSSLYEIKLIQSTKITLDVEMISVPLIYFDKPAILTMCIDISERKKATEKIKTLAYYDTLTNLPNRNMLNKCFDKILDMNKKQHIGVLFVDIDRFKIINDTMGHDFGDIVLKKVSEILIKCISIDDIIFRYGGDEFIILVRDTSLNKVKKVAEEIIEEFTNSLILSGNEIYISISIGISMYPEDGNNMETLIKFSDTAMYFVKENGKNDYKFYNSDLSKNISSKMFIEKGLRKALENNELILYYQPQYDLITREILGLEALIRWNHPEIGFIPPSEFITIAEETGLIIPIGEWVLKTICNQNKIWQEHGLELMKIAINISAIQFKRKDFVKSIKHILRSTNFNPQHLQLEITESLMKNTEKITGILYELKSLGIELAIDDFGTGYSSLSDLNYFPIDVLKIDQSFISNLIKDDSAKAITKTIIDMGNNLNLKVVAEGVENQKQVDFLTQNKCNIAQGYYFSEPLPAKEIEKLFSSTLR